eukprot:Pompholyxophrys_punicea_v1_NODE_221_length_2710_cov_3.829379.p1 type:complete len:101 gc:universal NODE_221_length_2710_cov_3.829379:1652-1350(-)
MNQDLQPSLKFNPLFTFAKSRCGHISSRTRSKIKGLSDVLHLAECNPIFTPSSYQEAITCDDNERWKAAIAEELAHDKNGTWTLEPLPLRKKPIGSKWIF